MHVEKHLTKSSLGYKGDVLIWGKYVQSNNNNNGRRIWTDALVGV